MTRLALGQVVAISGSRVEAVLEGNGHSGQDPDFQHAIQIGNLVKIRTAKSLAIGLVSGLAIREPTSPPSPNEVRIMDIDLLGECIQPGPEDRVESFRRGVSLYPVLGDPVLAAEHADLARIYAKPTTSCVVVGCLHQDESLPAYVVTDDLLSKHFAILGTTGSGKSCSAAVVLGAVLSAHPHGHVVLLDPHDEYAGAFAGLAEVVGPETLELPYWLLDFEELVQVACSLEPEAREVEAQILKEAVLRAKQEFVQGGQGGQNGGQSPASQDAIRSLTVDVPVPYRLTRLMELLREAMGRLNQPSGTLPYLRLLGRFETLTRDPRYGFMFSHMIVEDSMARVLGRLLRVPTNGRPVTIMNLAGVPSEIVDVVVSLVCRLIFDFAVWSEQRIPLLVVCEEAHRYVPRDAGRTFGPTRKAIARIAKEGRKYGVGLGLITQRPSEISSAILSQMNTLFALRLAGEADQEIIRHALPDGAGGLLRALPALRNQEAVVVGEGVTLPMRVRLAELAESQRPHRAAAPFSRAWQDESLTPQGLAAVIARWRRQARSV